MIFRIVSFSLCALSLGACSSPQRDFGLVGGSGGEAGEAGLGRGGTSGSSGRSEVEEAGDGGNIDGGAAGITDESGGAGGTGAGSGVSGAGASGSAETAGFGGSSGAGGTGGAAGRGGSMSAGAGGGGTSGGGAAGSGARGGNGGAGGADGCGASAPKLGCPCSSPGAAACNAPNSKLPVSCMGGQWVAIAGTSCGASQNCDQRDGTCHDIIAQCADQSPGFAFCDASAGAPRPPPYLEVRRTCGPDRVTTTNLTCSGVCDANLGCQNARCGDLKVEAPEQCDDGNNTALDGCEPAGGPVSVAACTSSRILSVSSGSSHTCGLFNGGYARCWGLNDSNQLGLGHTQPEGDRKPFELTVFDSNGKPQPAGPINFGNREVTAISAGSNFSCALLSDQSVRCWGINDRGQLGLGNTNPQPSATPASLGAVDIGGPVRSVAAGVGFACALLTNGNVRCWGSNAGRLGTGTLTDLSTSTPAQIAAMPAFPGWISLGAPATSIAVGGSVACALLTGGSVRCWGSNGSGALGTGMSGQLAQMMVPSAYSAVLLPSLKTATSITSGGGAACARLSDGTAECWGYNGNGQLGVGTAVDVGGALSSPATDGLVRTPAAGVDSIIAGLGSNTCAFFANGGGLHCWGDNSKGQLGYANFNTVGDTPQNLPSNPTLCPAINFGPGLSAVSISMGIAHACAVLNNGQLRCWGSNQRGQLGLGFVSQPPTDFVGGSGTTTPDNAVTIVPLFP